MVTRLSLTEGVEPNGATELLLPVPDTQGGRMATMLGVQSFSVVSGYDQLAPRPTQASPSGTPTWSDWSEHRATIKRLYIDEDRTLREVMGIMKRDFNFYATVKMYKSRFARWGYVKNLSIKESQLSQLLQLIKNRQQGDTPAHVVFHGRSVSIDKVASHIRRKKLAGQVPDGSSRAIYVVTETPSPLSSAVSSPDIFRASEAVFASVRKYVKGRYESGRANELEDMKISASPSKQSSDFIDSIYAIRQLLEQEDVTQALPFLKKAPRQIRDLLRSEPHEILTCFFLTVVDLSLDNPQKLRVLRAVKSLLRYAADFTNEIRRSPLESEHPLRQPLTHLAEVNDADLLPTAIEAWKCQLETWDSEIMSAPGSVATLVWWMEFGSSAGFECLPPHMGETLATTLNHFEAIFGERNERSLRVLELLAEYEAEKASTRGSSTNRAERLYEAMLARSSSKHQQRCAQYNLAYLHRERKRNAIAERYMQKAIVVQQELEGERSPGMISLMTVLEQWLVESGEHQRAADLRRRRTELCAAMGEDEA